MDGLTQNLATRTRKMSRNTLTLRKYYKATCRVCNWSNEYLAEEFEEVPGICPACFGSPMKAFQKVDQTTSRE